VIVKSPNCEEVAKVVTERMVEVPGIVRTHTITAFRAGAKADREAGPTPGAR
jgi:hypothetical protein